MAFCLPKTLTNIFLGKLKSGEISPEKMAAMTSKERHDYFKSFLGENNAKEVNASFESKLLLKNQQQGIINWAKQFAGKKPQVQRDILARVEKMDKVLTPETEDAFLADLAEHKLGTAVTMQEAGIISDLAKLTSDNKTKIQESSPIGSDERMAYGRARVDFEDYVNNLKTEAGKQVITEYLKPQNYGKVISNIAGLAKSLKASLDNSVIGRQGLKTLFTHPEIWVKNSKQSFVDIWNTFGGKNVMREVRADVMSRPNALNGKYQKEKVALGVMEEAYPVHLPSKIPVLGKAFQASENAFTAFQYRTRADLFDKYTEIAEKSGGDITGLGKLANSMTGRGNLGALEPSANTVNNVFFSPRFLKSNIDTLTAHFFDKNMGTFARKQAAINLVKIISGISAILAISKAIDKDSVETDPRSADFGKIRVGNTRFDVTAGMSTLAVLAARYATQSSKNSTSGKITKLDSGKYGAKTTKEVVYDFFEHKLSPAASFVVRLRDKKDFSGKKLTPVDKAKNLLEPLILSNYEELKNDPNSANVIISLIADALGISTNTYSKNKK